MKQISRGILALRARGKAAESRIIIQLGAEPR